MTLQIHQPLKIQVARLLECQVSRGVEEGSMAADYSGVKPF